MNTSPSQKPNFRIQLLYSLQNNESGCYEQTKSVTFIILGFRQLI
jgi:hypothetical protein